MSTLVVEKPRDLKDTVTHTETVTEPTQFSWQGTGSASVYFNGTLVSTLTEQNPIFTANVAGDYTFVISARCEYGAVFSDPLLSIAVSDNANATDGTAKFYVDTNGDPIFVETIYDEETETFTYRDTNGDPIVAGVDFFPAPDDEFIVETQCLQANQDSPSDYPNVGDPQGTAYKKGDKISYYSVNLVSDPLQPRLVRYSNVTTGSILTPFYVQENSVDTIGSAPDPSNFTDCGDKSLCAPVTVTQMIDPEVTPVSISGGYYGSYASFPAPGETSWSFVKIEHDYTYTIIESGLNTDSMTVNSLALNPNENIVYGLFGTDLVIYDIVAGTFTITPTTGIPASTNTLVAGGYDPITDQYIVASPGSLGGDVYSIDTDTKVATLLSKKITTPAGNIDIAFDADGVAYWTVTDDIYKDIDFYNPASTPVLLATVTGASPTSGASLGLSEDKLIYLSDDEIVEINKDTGDLTFTGNSLINSEGDTGESIYWRDLSEGFDSIEINNEYIRILKTCCDGDEVCYKDLDGVTLEDQEIIDRLIEKDLLASLWETKDISGTTGTLAGIDSFDFQWGSLADGSFTLTNTVSGKTTTFVANQDPTPFFDNLNGADFTFDASGATNLFLSVRGGYIV